MDIEKENFLLRAYQREKKARMAAEKIIEDKSSELYYTNLEIERQAQRVTVLNESLERKVEQRTKQLEEERQRAENLAKAKQQFLANMSHEIRTPMNAIMGFTKLLLRSTNLDSKQEKYLSAIRRSADNLLVIINDILDLSKIEGGKIELESKSILLGDMFSVIAENFAESVKAKNLTLNFSVDKNISVIKSDEVRLHQVFTNLIGNAVKFTHRGEISVQAQLISEDESIQKIKFLVSDTGIGIPSEKAEAIFESFTQVDQSTSRKYGGTGLGLAITKQLVGLFNGTIKVTSELNRGTTFEVTIPFLKGTTVMSGDNESEIEYSDALQGKRVLVAEDNDFNRFLIESVLEDWDVLFEVATNGQEVLELLSNREFDIVLMDIGMPVLNGFETTKIIREELNSNIPIVALTANAMKEDQKMCLENGMNAFISKPFDPNNLHKIMQGLLAGGGVSTPVDDNFHRDWIHKISKGNPSFEVELLSRLYSHINDRIVENQTFQINASHISVENILRELHDVKGSLKLLKEFALVKRIEDLERHRGSFGDQQKQSINEIVLGVTNVAKRIHEWRNELSVVRK